MRGKKVSVGEGEAYGTMTPIGPSRSEILSVKGRKYKILGIVTQWRGGKYYSYETSIWSLAQKGRVGDVGMILYESGPIETKDVATSSMNEYMKSLATRIRKTGTLPKKAGGSSPAKHGRNGKKHFEVVATYTSDQGKGYHETFPWVSAKSRNEAKRKVGETLRRRYGLVAYTLKVRKEKML